MGNESKAFAKSLSMLESNVGLRKSIDELLTKESKYVPVASICKEYKNRLDAGEPEETLYESFISDLSKVALHDSAKSVLFNLQSNINEHKNDINIVSKLYEMQSTGYGYIVPMIESALVDYMTDKTQESRTAARQTLSLFDANQTVKEILECLSFDEYEQKTNHKVVNSKLNEAMLPKEEKTYTKEELEAIVEAEKAKAIEESSKPSQKTIALVETHINLSTTIKKILERESRNESLKAFCEQYISALNSGKPEETLYESFISGVSNWNYLNAVDTELSALSDRISKYKQEIDLKKILRMMEQCGSYYIVPLIEGCVVDYIDNKNMQNKAILKQRLQAFEYDPFVRDILNVVVHDLSTDNSVYLGESIELLNSKVHTEKIFSPIQYIKENECVLNVKGIYYNRKGNSITKLSKSSIDNLDESFKTICNLINSDNVIIDDLSNSIKIFEGKDSAEISENDITINGESITETELANLANMSHLMNEHKEGFYAAIKLLNENFCKIAYIDFVKRVTLNESDAKSVDVFRIKNNIFVTTVDKTMGKTTFYRNVNPIQCRSYINEHMEINVAPLFEDVLPNQETIKKGIDETKNQYEEYIKELEDKKKELEEMKESAEGDDSDMADAIKLIDDELEDVKNDYKKYQEDSEKFISGDDKDSDEESVDADGIEDLLGDESGEEGEENTEEPAASDDVEISDVNPEVNPEDMETPIEQETDPLAGATPYNGLLDAPAPTSNDGYEVIKVSYAENIKTGTKSNKGEVYLMVPSVDANGDIHNEIKMVTFYLDQEKNPVINNEYMPVSMYNSIKSAVEACPDTAEIDVNSGQGALPDEEPANDVDAALQNMETVPVNTDGNLDNTEEPAADVPAQDTTNPLEDEPMDGLDDGGDEVFDIPFDTTSEEEGPATGAPDPETADATIDAILGDENNSSEEPIEDSSVVLPGDSSTAQETPAETANKEEGVKYPIELGLDLNDIRPIKGSNFTEALNKMGIKYSELESLNPEISIAVSNKAEAYALKNYFKEWKNFDDKAFGNFFPELKKCFDNNSSTIPVAVSETVKIIGVQAVNETYASTSEIEQVSLELPYYKEYEDAFAGAGLPYITSPVSDTIVVETDNLEDTTDLYYVLRPLIEDPQSEVYAEEHALEFVTDFAVIAGDEIPVFESVVYSMSIPYNGFILQKLHSKGVQVEEVDEALQIDLKDSDIKKVSKLFESFYKEEVPPTVKEFFLFAENSLQEGVKIIVKDDTTGKTVEINTDDLNDDENKEKSEDSDGSETTFNTDDSALFNSDEDSAESSNKKDEEHKEEKNEEAKPEKKKFKFRVKPKKTDEYVKEETKPEEILNESAAPNVMDYVRCNDGKIGQIISSLPNGDFIVNVDCKTVQCSPSSVSLVREKLDTVPCQFKYDKSTLKGLFEQMVQCGMFMNNVQITPSDCYVKYSEFIDAKDDEDIRLMIEGEQVLANKKFIKITEDVNDFANINDYVEGVEISENGQVIQDLLLNLEDYNDGAGSASPVRVLIPDGKGEYKLSELPKGSIEPKSI